MQDLVLYDESSLALLIGAARRQIRQTSGRWLAPHGLTPQQFMVLMTLRERGEAFLREVAESVWVDNPTASRIVRALADRGLVHHAPSDKHGRRLALSLTPEGKDLVGRLSQLRNQLLEEMVRDFTPQEADILRQGLRKVIANLSRLEELPAAPRPKRD